MHLRPENDLAILDDVNGKGERSGYANVTVKVGSGKNYLLAKRKQPRRVKCAH
jgi:hypothetical protein